MEKINKPKKKGVVERAVQWLKERGVNPHLGDNDVVMEHFIDEHEPWIAKFDMYDGRINVPVFGMLELLGKGSKIPRGVIEHEAFHRGDFLDKVRGTKEGRQKIYEEWKATKEMEYEFRRHEEYLDGKHLVFQAFLELKSKGYDPRKSMIKLWRKDPEEFKKMLNIATAMRSLEAKEVGQRDGQISAYEQMLRVGWLEVDESAIQRLRERLKRFFTHTPVKRDKREVMKRMIYKVLTEIPAYMITCATMGYAPENGITIAKAMVGGKKYFKRAKLEKMARDAAKNYQTIARILRKKGLDDEQIVRAILALHKNIYTPEDAEMFVQNKRMLGNAAEAVKAGGFDAKDIRTALAVQTLVKMDESVRKWPRLAGVAGRIRLDNRRRKR